VHCFVPVDISSILTRVRHLLYGSFVHLFTLDPTATVAVGGLAEADGGAPGVVRDVLLGGHGDAEHTTEAGELTRCLSGSCGPDSIIFMDSTDSGTEEMADVVCQEPGDTLDADRKCRIDMCGACDSTDV